MKILGNDFEALEPLAENVLLEVAKEELELLGSNGLILSPQKTVFIRSKVLRVGPSVQRDISPGDYVELNGTAVPSIFDENYKCRLMMAPEEAIIAVYRQKK